MIYSIVHLAEMFPFLQEEGRDPTLEVYLPEPMAEMGRGDEKRPCMLVLPGGGYHFVSRREAEPIALHLLPYGYNVFVLNYSVDPHGFPVQLQEVAAALEMLCHMADHWNCDTQRLAIMGFSAGGHLAAHYCNRYDCPQVRQRFPESKAVNAAVLCYPVITADPRYAHENSIKRVSGLPLEAATDFSCENMVTESTPPTFLWHCTGDKAVPVQNSLLYASALADKGVPFRLNVYPHGKHGLSTADPVTNAPLPPETEPVRQWLADMRQWLQLTLNRDR